MSDMKPGLNGSHCEALVTVFPTEAKCVIPWSPSEGQDIHTKQKTPGPSGRKPVYAVMRKCLREDDPGLSLMPKDRRHRLWVGSCSSSFHGSPGGWGEGGGRGGQKGLA